MKKLILVIAAILIIPTCLFAQSTILTLPAADSSASFKVENSVNVVLMRLNGDAGFYIGEALSTGTIPTTGTGTRLMWYPAKAAFRAGTVTGDKWDANNTGNASVAMGANTLASGYESVALGGNTTASGSGATAIGSSTNASGINSTALGGSTTANGSWSTALGYGTFANGDYSTAMGNETTAGGDYSSAMGDQTTAIGISSTAWGYKTTASGNKSTAMGDETTASGSSSTAMGQLTIASEDCSTAIGLNTTASGYVSTAIGDHTTANGYWSTALGSYVSVGGYAGAFIIGDHSTTTVKNCTTENQIIMRFSGGYKFYSNSGCTTGVALNEGGNSWSTISDSLKKYAFLSINGESVLKKIDKFNLRTWSYKGQDSTKFRHYGPMAQEFFSAFGHDKYGVSGNDTTINQADLMGVNLIAIQALIKRTHQLSKQNAELKKENAKMKSELTGLSKSVEELKTIVSGMVKN